MDVKSAADQAIDHLLDLGVGGTFLHYDDHEFGWFPFKELLRTASLHDDTTQFRFNKKPCRSKDRSLHKKNIRPDLKSGTYITLDALRILFSACGVFVHGVAFRGARFVNDALE